MMRLKFILALNKCVARLGDVQAMQKPMATNLLVIAIEKYQKAFTGEAQNQNTKPDALAEAQAAKMQLDTLFSIEWNVLYI